MIIEFVSGVIVPCTIWYLTHRAAKRREKGRDSLKEDIEFSNTIYNKLEQIKSEYNTDRIWLAQFHNGGNYYPTGKSIQKFSMIYEIVESHVNSIQHQFQNIPVSLFARSINQLSENDIININDVENINIVDYGLRAIAEENSTKSQYIFTLRNIEGRFIGMLGIEYIQKITELNHDIINELNVECASIGNELMKYLNKK